MNALKLQYKAMIQVLNIKTPLLLLAGISFTWFTVEYVPSVMIFFWLVIAIFGDLVTGLLKSWTKGHVTTSTGLRKTVVKISSYCGAILIVFVLVNIVGIIDAKNTYDLSLLINSLMGFMVFTELYSMCENISQAYPESPLVKWLICPIMKFLRGKLQNNPLNHNNNQTP